MTCPEWIGRTSPADVSGVLSGTASVLSGMSVPDVRNGFRRAFRTRWGYVGSPCPEWSGGNAPVRTPGATP